MSQHAVVVAKTSTSTLVEVGLLSSLILMIVTLSQKCYSYRGTLHGFEMYY